MPNISTEITFLANIPLYDTEKPYFLFWAAGDEKQKPIPSTNIQWQTQEDILVKDIRGKEKDFTLKSNDFEILYHLSGVSFPITSVEDMERYKRETETLLKQNFNARAIYCYESRVCLLFATLQA